MAACWLRTVSEMFTPLGNELQNIFQTFIWMKLACLSKTYISRWISEASFLSFLYWLSACIPKLSLNTANVGYFPSFKSKHLLVYCKHFLHLTLSWKYWGLFRYLFPHSFVWIFFIIIIPELSVQLTSFSHWFVNWPQRAWLAKVEQAVWFVWQRLSSDVCLVASLLHSSRRHWRSMRSWTCGRSTRPALASHLFKRKKNLTWVSAHIKLFEFLKNITSLASILWNSGAGGFFILTILQKFCFSSSLLIIPVISKIACKYVRACYWKLSATRSLKLHLEKSFSVHFIFRLKSSKEWMRRNHVLWEY